VLPVIEYADEYMDKQAFNMMTMARLCELPECLEELSLLAENLSLSTHSDILDVSLCTLPKQKKVSFDELGETVDFLGLV